ncbi:hypothetical protein F5884DRAFT_773964 [Xylogone sp. PMI_703]|nr:hypothetical protein F5884DRAFT_773964 [Xylogone sp. PMI_703]
MEQSTENGSVLFSYAPQGELEHSLRFTPEEMLTFIQKHPYHRRFGTRNPDFGLTLWIQVTPHNCKDRYPQKDSDTCRFQDCPIASRKIRKGQFRIAFDERLPGPPRDPFHNPGYVHLYCMEKFLDFPLICKQYNVRPDNRRLPYEDKNRMSITRDHPQMLTRVVDFIRDSVPGIPRTEFNYKKSLTFILTREHLYRESASRQIIREESGGNHIAKWMGNLDLFSANQEEIIAKRRRERRKQKKKVRFMETESSHKQPNKESKKRSRRELDEESLEEWNPDDSGLGDDRRNNPRSCMGLYSGGDGSTLR